MWLMMVVLFLVQANLPIWTDDPQLNAKALNCYLLNFGYFPGNIWIGEPAEDNPLSFKLIGPDNLEIFGWFEIDCFAGRTRLKNYELFEKAQLLGEKISPEKAIAKFVSAVWPEKIDWKITFLRKTKKRHWTQLTFLAKGKLASGEEIELEIGVAEEFGKIVFLRTIKFPKREQSREQN